MIPPSLDEAWVLEEMAGVSGVEHTLLVTTDGLLMAASAGLDRATADRLAAACAGLFSAGHAAALQLDQYGPVPHVMVELPDSYLFVREAAGHARLAVVARQNIDPGLVSYTMQELINKIGKALDAPGRP